MNTVNIVVFGTSLLWGQGLKDEDKIHNVLARLIEERSKDCKANVAFLAHSGASTGYKRDGSIDTHREPRINGEVPTLYPTILQEIEEFDGKAFPADAVDVVLLDAGINDVHVQSILDPLVLPHQLEKDIDIYCYQHMKLLIEALLKKFPKAKIIIVAYYEFITEQSEDDYIHTLLKAFGKYPAGKIADALLELAKPIIKRRLLTNCDVFAGESLEAFQKMAEEINRSLSKERVVVANPQFKPENAAFASDPWLFGINDDLSPQDPCAAERKSACQAAGLARTQPLFCKKASAGHPNPKGARAYAETILSLF